MARKRKLRIASYNINGINSRLHVLTRWLEEFQPDIVGLQELKCTDENFPRDAIEAQTSARTMSMAKLSFLLVK